MIAYGALWFGLYTVAVNAAGRYLDAGTSAMLVNLAPIIIAVLAGLFLGEGFPRGLVVGLAIAFAGVVTISLATTTGRISPLGVGLALAAAGLYAVGVLLQKQALRTVDPVTVTWLGAVAGVVATLPFAPALVAELAAAPASAVLGMVYLGVFPTAIAFSLWTYALAHTTAGRMSASSYVVPGIAVLMSWVFLAEVPVPLALIGGAISLAGVGDHPTRTGAPASGPRTSASQRQGVAERHQPGDVDALTRRHEAAAQVGVLLAGLHRHRLPEAAAVARAESDAVGADRVAAVPLDELEVAVAGGRHHAGQRAAGYGSTTRSSATSAARSARTRDRNRCHPTAGS